MTDERKCKDCIAERSRILKVDHPEWTEIQIYDMAVFSSRRPAPQPGPRCVTHHRIFTRRAKDRQADTRRAGNFGITGTTYRELVEFQGGTCVCGGQSRKRLAVDHDHSCCPGPTSCGRCIRGALCQRCNDTLASFRDDAAKLRALADYLDHPTMERMRERGREVHGPQARPTRTP